MLCMMRNTLGELAAKLGFPKPDCRAVVLTVDKTLTIKRKRVKLNVQLFNATNHFNPRDVFAVVGAPRFGTFVNSIGPTVRGDIGVDW